MKWTDQKSRLELDCIPATNSSRDSLLTTPPAFINRSDRPRELEVAGQLEIVRADSAAATAKLWESSDAACLAWLQPEDRLYPGMAEKVVAFFAAHPDCDVAYGSARLVDRQGKSLDLLHPRPPRLSNLRRRMCLSPAATFIRKSALGRFGTLDGNWHYWAVYEYWLRLAAAGARFRKLNEVIAQRVMTPDNPLLSLAQLDELPLACDELINLLSLREGHVNGSWALWIGRASIAAETFDSTRLKAYDQAVLSRAIQTQREAGRGSAISSLQLQARYYGGDSLMLLRRHSLSQRMLKNSLRPLRLRERIKEFKSTKLFRLHGHLPRPLRLAWGPGRRGSSPPRTPADLPSIALVTPNYNCGRFIERTIRSVLDQQYPKLAYHVQDGASKDCSIEVIQRYADRISSWESVRDGGQTQAINLGFRRVEGDVMGWLNSDDVLLPRALERVGHFFATHPEVDVIYGHRLLIDGDDRVINRWILPPHDPALIQWADYIPQETMFWRKEIWERAGGKVDEQFQFAMDWDLILRFRRAGARFHRLPRILAAFRITEEQKTNQLAASIGQRESSLLRQQELGWVPNEKEVIQRMRSFVRRHWWIDKLHAVQQFVGLQERY